MWSRLVLSGPIWGLLTRYMLIFQQKGHPIDENGNIVVGTNKHTVFVGLTNCMLVSTEDAVLVLDRSRAQEVKQIYEHLEKENSPLV